MQKRFDPLTVTYHHIFVHWLLLKPWNQNAIKHSWK